MLAVTPCSARSVLIQVSALLLQPSQSPSIIPEPVRRIASLLVLLLTLSAIQSLNVLRGAAKFPHSIEIPLTRDVQLLQGVGSKSPLVRAFALPW